MSDFKQNLETIKKHKKVLNYIRHYDSFDISAVAEVFRVSWPTMKSIFNNLYENGIIIKNTDSKNHQPLPNPDFGYMLGISIGAAETKVSLIDFNFNPVDWNSKLFSPLLKQISDNLNLNKIPSIICYNTEHDFLTIHRTTSQVISLVYKFLKKHNLNLISLGITLPGIIDRHTNKMLFCSNLPELMNINVLHILSDDILKQLESENISICISHDVTAATVYEKEWTYKQYFDNKKNCLSKNMAVIYLGTGLASGYIFENKLLLGTTGTGEIGHLDLPYIDLPLLQNEQNDYYYISDNQKQKIYQNTISCMCGKKNCLESLIRTKVFNSYSTADFLSKIESNSLLSFNNLNPYKYRILCHFITLLLNITINMLNVDTILLTGRVFNGIPELKEDITGLKIQSSLGCFSEDCKVSFGSSRPDTVAIGAAILSYYKLLCEPNNTFEIEW